MKCKVKGKELTTAINAALAVHDFGDTTDSHQPCVLTAEKDQLMLQSAKLGAFVVKRIPATLLREGSVGLNAKDLAEMKLKGAVTIDVANGAAKFSDGKTMYHWATDSSAVTDIEEQKSAVVAVVGLAKIPTQTMKSGAQFATYKSEVRGDYDVQITIDKSYFEYCGLDHISYGRYEFNSDAVRAKERFHFTLGTSLLAKIMKEVEGDVLTIGMSEDGSTVRLSSADFDLYHPTIDKQYQDTATMVAHVTAGADSKCTCSFDVAQRELKDAIDNVAPVGKKDADAQMEIAITANGVVTLRQHAQDNTATSRLKTENTKVRKGSSIIVRAQYLKEFVKAAPTTIPLKVESWNEKYLRILVQDDPGTIDYLALMIAE